MQSYKAPRAIISIDGEFASLEADAAIIDTGIVVYLLNDDGLSYTLVRYYHQLTGMQDMDPKRTKSRRTLDWWLNDARSEWNPCADAIAYVNMPVDQLEHHNNYPSRHKQLLVKHAMFITKTLRDYNIDRLDFVVCAKGPDTDCAIYNNAFAMDGIDFNYRFARYSNVRDIERGLAAFHAGGLSYDVAECAKCSIPFAPKGYYPNGEYLRPGASDNPWHNHPPAVEHVGLYDAWLEGNAAVEYYTLLNLIAAKKLP